MIGDRDCAVYRINVTIRYWVHSGERLAETIVKFSLELVV